MSDSDMDMDLLEESEDELNKTTFFNDDIDISTDETDGSNSDSVGGSSSEHGVNEKFVEIVDNNKEPGDNHIEVPMNIVEDGSKREFVENKVDIQAKSEDDYTEVSMVLSPIEMKSKHTTQCPVCYEISILCKDSTLYDNLILACIQQRSIN